MSARDVRLISVTILVHVLLAIGTYGLMLLAERSGLTMFRPLERVIVFADVPKYFEHANRAMTGQVPYRDDFIEYPVLALPFIFAPRILARSQAGFVAVFAVEMLVFDALLIILVARRVARTLGPELVGASLAWLTAFFTTVSPFAIGRYDLVPAVLAFASAGFWFGTRPGLGGILAAIGFLAKIVPGAVAIIGTLGEVLGTIRPRTRGSSAFALVVGTGIALWFGVGGPGAVASLRYHSGRGLEIGSLPSGLLWVCARLVGWPMRIVQDHDSLNLIANCSVAIANRAILLQLMVMGAVAITFVVGRGRDPFRFAAAAVVAFVVGGKVLSPQYLLWIMPFVASIGGAAGRWSRPAFLAASIATMLLYPWGTGGVARARNMGLGDPQLPQPRSGGDPPRLAGLTERRSDFRHDCRPLAGTRTRNRAHVGTCEVPASIDRARTRL